jgi:light-regulated signal transduction histidine kinase (bacteriophytochrome)/CheY-like chemotaxis protein
MSDLDGQDRYATAPDDPASVCAQEPITTPGSIQPHGALLGVDPEKNFRICVVSANCEALFPVFGPAKALLGRDIADIFGLAFVTALTQRFATGRLRGAASWQSTVSAIGPGLDMDITVHAQSGLVLIEIEHRNARDEAEALIAGRQLQEALIELKQSRHDLSGLAFAAASAIRGILGYERVLVYRFAPDWAGQTIAEDKTPDWAQSLDGLHFPAGDIPPQARELYRKSPMRWVPNRDTAPVPLLCDAAAPPPEKIDLSFARLRSQSPMHLQYHRNMGVNGAMSLSIQRDDQLWGLIVCHHRQPHYPSPGQRAAAAVLVDAFALGIGPAEHSDTELSRRADLQRLAALFSHMAEAESVAAALTTGPVTIADMFAASGAAVVSDGEIFCLGNAPPAADIGALANWLRAEEQNKKIVATENLAAIYPAWLPHAPLASGVLAIFLAGPESTDMLLWFRPEEPHLVAWGGDPAGKTGPEASLPRQSFERWVDTRHNIARPWLPWELEIAESLRHDISDVILRSLRRITELNERLRQAQKMETVGQLTGGLAHDFNNLLCAIAGGLELAQTRIAQGRFAEVQSHLSSATSAADRATALVSRLLSFSRHQTLAPQAVNLNDLTTAMESLLRHTLGSRIKIETILPEDLWHIFCDGNQLDNVLLNLAINARDAMPDGGTLTIEAGNLELKAPRLVRGGEIAPGHYVTLAVTDTGSGMDELVIERVFEPFFTTKPNGQGTGLGLSMVYGFVQQSSGFVEISSTPAAGTTVRLYLPRHQDAAPAAPPAPALASEKTVLVVDDEPVVRMLLVETLQDLGYQVVEAANGAEAIKIMERTTRIDLLVTDVGLPGGMTGRELADTARATRPTLQILFITGYADANLLSQPAPGPRMELMTKPFALDVLAAKIKTML